MHTLSQLLQAAEAIELQDIATAEALLGEIAHATIGQQTPLERLSSQFVQGLQARMQRDRSGTGNLYLTEPLPASKDMLTAYQVLVEVTPLIRFGYAYANHALMHTLQYAARIHIIDIGIGSGTQWLHFFEQIRAWTPPPPSIRLTGIDIPVSAADPLQRLQQVGHVLQSRAEQLGISLVFHPIASRIETLDWRQLEVSSNDPVAVNATLALHHTPSADAVTEASQSRDAILRRIFALKPRILTLIEPDAEHNSLPFVQRIQEAFRHYLAVFEALDTLLGRCRTEQAILEDAFFGKEVVNIVAAEGPDRVERHKRSASWRQRLAGLGFNLIPFSQLAVRHVQRALSLSMPFRVSVDDRMTILSFGETPLLAASAWRT